MSEQPKSKEGLVNKFDNFTDENENIYKKYKDIKDYEQHFNNLETEIRKLASIWLLATLGAIAFLIKVMYLGGAGNSSSTQIDAKILVSLVSFMGTLGLLLLFILDQMVYHRLLNAVFLLRLRMEYCHSFIPPIGTLMMLFSRKRGMAWYMRFYYLIPMFTLAIIALISSVFNVYGNEFKTEVNSVAFIIGLFTLMVPLWAYMESEGKELYKDIADGFGDSEFENFLTSLFDKKMKKKEYEKILQNH